MRGAIRAEKAGLLTVAATDTAGDSLLLFLNGVYEFVVLRVLEGLCGDVDAEALLVFVFVLIFALALCVGRAGVGCGGVCGGGVVLAIVVVVVLVVL
jgi:hypothetical protein